MSTGAGFLPSTVSFGMTQGGQHLKARNKNTKFQLSEKIASGHPERVKQQYSAISKNMSKSFFSKYHTECFLQKSCIVYTSTFSTGRWFYFFTDSFPPLLGTCAALHHSLSEATRWLRNVGCHFHLGFGSTKWWMLRVFFSKGARDDVDVFW